MSNPVDRVAEAAQTIKPLRLLLSVLAFPFYLLGLIAGLVVVAIVWVFAAVQVGYADVRPSSPTEVDPDDPGRG